MKNRQLISSLIRVGRVSTNRNFFVFLKFLINWFVKRKTCKLLIIGLICSGFQLSWTFVLNMLKIWKTINAKINQSMKHYTECTLKPLRELKVLLDLTGLLFSFFIQQVAIIYLNYSKHVFSIFHCLFYFYLELFY